MKKFIMFGFVPALVSIIACLQLYNSQTSTLSRWKGAGFGMYTSIHPYLRKIIVDDTVFNNNKDRDNISSFSKEKKQLLVYPNDKTLKQFLEKEDITPKKHLRIYKVSFSLEDKTYVYDSYIFEKSFK
jgi:hypothetical protein